MEALSDFYKQLTTLQILYYMPDPPHLLQEFTWQTLDVPPRFPRVHRFLNFWHSEIEAAIFSVNVVVRGKFVPIDLRTIKELGNC